MNLHQFPQCHCSNEGFDGHTNPNCDYNRQDFETLYNLAKEERVKEWAILEKKFIAEDYPKLLKKCRLFAKKVPTFRATNKNIRNKIGIYLDTLDEIQSLLI